MDALGHAIECYTNNACQPISAALALRAIELIAYYLRSAVLNGRDRRVALRHDARKYHGRNRHEPDTIHSHALSDALGSWNLRVPHGIAVAVTLPVVMEFNYLAEPGRFADVARALGCRIDHLSRLDAAKCSIEAHRNLLRDLGISTSLLLVTVCAKNTSGPLWTKQSRVAMLPSIHAAPLQKTWSKF